MLNKVVLMGRLTAAPELKNSSSGLSVCAFTVAVERNYKDDGGQRQTDFVPCVAWRQTAEFVCKYFAKGSMIAVVGALQSRQYETKDGQKRTAYEVVCEQISFTGEKTGDRAEPTKSAASKSGYTMTEPAYASSMTRSDYEEADDDHLPF